MIDTGRHTGNRERRSRFFDSIIEVSAKTGKNLDTFIDVLDRSSSRTDQDIMRRI